MSSDIDWSAEDLTDLLLDDVDGVEEAPRSTLVERWLLSAVMRDPSRFDALGGAVQPEHFYLHAHRHIWRAVGNALASSRQPNGDITEGATGPPSISYELGAMGKLAGVESQLARDGMSLEQLASVCDDPSRAPRCAELLLVYAGSRDLYRALASSMRDLAMGRGSLADVLKSTTERIAAVGAVQIGDGSGPKDVSSEAEREHVARLEGEKCPEIATTIEPLDALLDGGLMLGESYCIGGLSGHGKTTVATAMSSGLSDAGCVVLMFSSEVTANDVCYRILATKFARAGIEEWMLRKPHKILNPITRGRVVELRRTMFDWYAQSTIFVVKEDDIDVEAVRTKAQALRAMHPDKPIVVLVDYVQKCRAPGAKGEVEHINRSAAHLAGLPDKVSDSLVIYFSQYTMSSDEQRVRPIPLPDKSQARYGGDISNAAANFLVYHRPWEGDRGDEHELLNPDELTLLVQQKSRFDHPRYAVMKSDLQKKTFGWWPDDFIEQSMQGIDISSARLVTKGEWDRLCLERERQRRQAHA